MKRRRKRILIQKRFRTHRERTESVERVLECLPKGEYIVIAKVNRQYIETVSCAFYLPRNISLTGIEYDAKQRLKNAQ